MKPAKESQKSLKEFMVVKNSKTAIARVLGPEPIGEKFINLIGFVKILLGTFLFQEIHMMEIIFGVFGVLDSRVRNRKLLQKS